MKLRVAMFFIAAAICWACGGSLQSGLDPASVDKLSSETVRAELLREIQTLSPIRDRFISAGSLSQMTVIMKEAEAVAPNAWITHEMRAFLARLRGEYQQSNEALINALATADPINARVLLARLNRKYLSKHQEERLLNLLSDRVRWVPSTNDRHEYATWLYRLAKDVGDTEKINQAVQALGHVLTPWIIGPFDNDQGKGFDVVAEPERRGVFPEAVPGTVVDVNWRRPLSLTKLGNLPLKDIVSPTKWQTVYAQSEFELEQAQQVELRISTSDPVKVWLDGQLVFQSRTIAGYVTDNVKLAAFNLESGRHRVLVKSMNESGPWLLRMRLTGANGGQISGLVREITEMADIKNPSRAKVESVTEEPVAVNDVQAPVYERFVRAEALMRLRQAKSAVEALQRLHTEHPKSVLISFAFVAALIDNEERGKASDLLNALQTEHGDTVPYASIKLASFWSAQKMRLKARALLKKRLSVFTDNLGLSMSLASNYDHEGWHEEESRLMEALNRRYPNILGLKMRLAQSYQSLKQYPRAEQMYRSLFRHYPGRWQILRKLTWLTLGNDRFDEAIKWCRYTLDAFPTSKVVLSDLAEVYRRSQRYSEAAEVLRKAILHNPTSGSPWQKLARIYLIQGDTEQATKAFRQGLERDPDNRQVANRVAWLAPTDDGPWRADVPTDQEINAAIANRGKFAEGIPGANVVALIDDEVTWLQKDGSTYNIVTYVMHALNQEGRDEITKMRIRGGGRHQLLNAFAVNSMGQRIEASSIRGRSVRYRQLDVGSTVVLQYRIDSRPEAYLSGHIDRGFWFHSTGTACAKGRWVLWVPKAEIVHQKRTSQVAFKEEVMGDFRRLEWSARDMAPIVREPSMPPIGQVAERVSMSTVPNWSVFAEWEKALLVDAYRDSPEVKRIAKEILGKAKTNEERVKRIHEYVIENIRYQQDYEVTIAGVKPHAAAQVLARQYGDCKDKAVLFIALAKEAGIDVHFASVRTRDRGPIMRNVPSQQFNHAIVYVPKQSGIALGRFYDPTVDTLDLEVLRSDDQGTLAYVYDANKKLHYWKTIPFQAPEVDHMDSEVTLRLKKSGDVEGALSIGGAGDVGAWLRGQARNPTKFRQSIAQSLANTAALSAQVSEVAYTQVERLDTPVRIDVVFSGKGRVRQEGTEQRWQVPLQATKSSILNVKDRKYAFLQGKPRTMRWQVAMQVPQRSTVVRLPQAVLLDHRCVKYRRTVSKVKDTVKLAQEIQIKCERVPLAEVPAVQALFSEIARIEEGELVLRY